MTAWRLVAAADETPDGMAGYSEGDDAPGLPIPEPPADVARSIRAERVRRSLHWQLAATPAANPLHADPDACEDELCRRNPHM